MLIWYISFCCLYLLYIHNYFLQVPRRFVPPQKAYNLRGVVSRKQDLEISPSPNLEQNSATFLSAGMAPGYIWAFGLHASQRVRSNCAEYLFKFNIKKYYCQCRALLCCASSPNKDPNHIEHFSLRRLFSVLNIETAENYTSTSTVESIWADPKNCCPSLDKQLHEWQNNVVHCECITL